MNFVFLKDVGKVPFEEPVGDGAAIAERIGPGSPVALLENNGALIAGRTVLDAVDRFEVLEATSAAIIRGGVLGPLTPMSDVVIDDLMAAFPNV